jgi:hypothetical protein
MNKSKNGRKISSIYEIKPYENKIEEITSLIFKYEPQNQHWDMKINLFDTNIINKLRQHEFIGDKYFQILFNLYRDIFGTLMNIKKMSNQNLIKLFDQLSYYSMTPDSSIFTFWENWKKSSGLN